MARVKKKTQWDKGDAKVGKNVNYMLKSWPFKEAAVTFMTG